MKCGWCQQEMTDDATVSCVANTDVVFPDDEKMPSVPHDGDWRCGDCHIAAGGFHHPGCDMERCPRCGGQLISCGCLSNEGEQ